MLRPGHFDIVERHVLHQLRRVDALLVARSDQVMERHAGNRDNRRAVHVCVVKAIEEVDGAGTCGADADAKLTCVFGEAGRHEGRRFLVTHADVLDPILTLAQRLDNGVDAVTDHAEAVRRPPGDQGFDHDIGCRQIRREFWRRLGRPAG